MFHSHGVYVDPAPYVRSHGKAPRGRGGWGFADVNRQNDIDAVRFFNGSYQDARAQAVKAMDPPSGVIVVMP